MTGSAARVALSSHSQFGNSKLINWNLGRGVISIQIYILPFINHVDNQEETTDCALI